MPSGRSPGPPKTGRSSANSATAPQATCRRYSGPAAALDRQAPHVAADGEAHDVHAVEGDSDRRAPRERGAPGAEARDQPAPAGGLPDDVEADGSGAGGQREGEAAAVRSS